MKYYIESWKRWCDFKGRSSREAFWISHLFDIIFFFILIIFMGILGGSPEVSSEGSFESSSEGSSEVSFWAIYVGLSVGGYFFARFLSLIALSIRRLHDTNRSGWWLLMILLPVGQIVLLIYYLEDSYIDENKYGKNPKE